jgi:DNA polymerase III subunit delta'
MQFQNFIGNERLVQWLEHAITSEQLRHAYLFTGPQKIGKRTLALTFAQAIQCEQRQPNGDACGNCVACRKLEHGNHPDVLIFTLPKDKLSYSIDQIRELIEEASLKPTEGIRRIFIIPDADRLTLPAIQASLKILEEPPPSGLILLTCTSKDLLLPTVISRCQEVPLLPVASEILATALTRRDGITDEQANRLALLSSGRPGWAIEASEKPESLEEQRTLLHELMTLIGSGVTERITAAGKYAADKEQAKYIIELWLPWWHDVLLAANGAQSTVRHREDLTTIEAIAGHSNPQQIEAFVRAQVAALEALEQNGNSRLVFEIMLQAMP